MAAVVACVARTASGLRVIEGVASDRRKSTEGGRKVRKIHIEIARAFARTIIDIDARLSTSVGRFGVETETAQARLQRSLGLTC